MIRELLAIDGLAEQGEAFQRKLVELADRVKADPSFIAADMRFESRFNPAAVNPYSGATGLIQFMPSTAELLGTTTAALGKMDALEQLDWVEAYFQRFAGKLHSLEDHYLAVFAPIGIGKAPDFVLYAKPTKAYEQNKGLDKSGDGTITAEEATAPVRGFVLAAMNRPRLEVEMGEGGAAVPTTTEKVERAGLDAVGIFACLAGVFMAARRRLR